MRKRMNMKVYQSFSLIAIMSLLLILLGGSLSLMQAVSKTKDSIPVRAHELSAQLNDLHPTESSNLVRHAPSIDNTDTITPFVEFVGQIGGATYDIAVQGDYAYIGVGPRLVILDIADPVNPIVVGQSLPMPEVVEAIAVFGDYAYIANWFGGLRIIDVSNVAEPVEVGSYNAVAATDVVAANSYVYVVDSSTLKILNVSDPANPAEIGTFYFMGDCDGIAVTDIYAYLACKSEGLRIINVSNPTLPVEVGSYDTEYANNVTVVGDYAYVADDEQGLRIIDLSNPASPIEVSRYDTGGSAKAVTVVGSYAYIADKLFVSRLLIVDVSNPNTPSEVGTHYTSGYIQNVVVIAPYAYIADYSGMRIVSVSIPTNPTEVSFYDMPAYINNVAIVGNYAYVADNYSGLHIFEVSNPARPKQIASRISFSGNNRSQAANDVAVVGSYAYVTDIRGLGIIDVSDPANAREVGSRFTTGYPQGIAVSGTYAYLAAYYGGSYSALQIIDISNPITPTLVGSYEFTEGSAYDVVVTGTHAYVANRGGGLRVVDVSNPISPTEVSSVDMPGGVNRVAIAGNNLYVAANSGLHVLDLSNPIKPTEIGFYNQFAQDISIASPFAYVVNPSSGLHVIDLSNPINPTEMAAYDIAGYPQGVATRGTYAYIASGRGGFWITELVSPGLCPYLLNSVCVLDENGLRAPGASVYRNGNLVVNSNNQPRVTNHRGILTLTTLHDGDTLVAIQPVYTQTTNREAHDSDGSGYNTAFRVYHTNLPLDNEGEVSPYTVPDSDMPHTLMLNPSNTLVLFNIVVSIEWDANQAYLASIEEALRQASNYLYDITDGQMAFGQVQIYDNARYWSHADFQISTKNTVHPYAFIGGITSLDTAHSIRIGRFWNGSSGNKGEWDQPNGYRTMIHEFGHYGLYLYDEYFVRNLDGSIEGCDKPECRAACTGIEVIGDDDTSTNASIMYYQYNTSELADNDRWTINCQNTEQARVNGQSDWQTVLAHYGGSDWELHSPTSRGSIMAGPETFPADLLSLPMILTHESGVDPPPRQLTVFGPNGQPFSKVLVALYTTPYSQTIAIDQGLTDEQGQLTIYGAVEGDSIHMTSFDGAFVATEPIDERLTYEVTLSSSSPGRRLSQGSEVSPYLNLVPGSEGDTLSLQLHVSSAGDPPLIAVVIPSKDGGHPQSTSLAYSAADEAYIGQVSFANVGLGSGETQISGIADQQLVSINSNYNLFQLFNADQTDLASEDGNLQLHLAADSLISANAYAAIFPTGYAPKALPNGKQILGSAYGIRFSGAATQLTKSALLTMHYHPEVTGHATDLAIYHWNPATQNWLLIGGEASDIDNAITAAVTQLGIYALGGSLASATPANIYLPLILK